MLQTHIETVLDKRDAITVFQAEQGTLSAEHEAVIRANRERYDSIFRELYDEGVSAGEFRRADSRIAIATLLSACRSTYRWVPELGVDEREVASQIVGLLADGFIRG